MVPSLVLMYSEVPMPLFSHPGRYVQRIDFSHFRTIGMRRLTGEAIKHRFVTSERLENVLKVRNILSICFFVIDVLLGMP